MKEIASMLGEMRGTGPQTQRGPTLEQMKQSMDAGKASLKPDEPVPGQLMMTCYFYWMHTGKVDLGPDEEMDNARYPQVKFTSMKEFLSKILKA